MQLLYSCHHSAGSAGRAAGQMTFLTELEYTLNKPSLPCIKVSLDMTCYILYCGKLFAVSLIYILRV